MVDADGRYGVIRGVDPAREGVSRSSTTYCGTSRPMLFFGVSSTTSGLGTTIHPTMAHCEVSGSARGRFGLDRDDRRIWCFRLEWNIPVPIFRSIHTNITARCDLGLRVFAFGLGRRLWYP